MISLRLLFAVCAAVSLAGCVNLLPKPAPAPIVYSLEAAPRGALVTRAEIKDIVIAVAEPSATRALSGRDIPWRKDGALSYIEGASWEERNVDLQTLLVDTIDRRGAVRGAIRSGDGTANVEVRWDIAAFEVDEDNGLKAVIRTSVKLFDARTRQLIMSTEVDETSQLSDRSARVAAAALEKAAQAAAVRIADWAADKAPWPAPSVGRKPVTGEPGPTVDKGPQAAPATP